MCVVQLRCNIFEIATILNEFNQSLERKKNLSSLIYVLKKFDKLPIRKFCLLFYVHFLLGLCNVQCLDQEHSMQNLLWNIIYNFNFKIQPVNRIFFASWKIWRTMGAKIQNWDLTLYFQYSFLFCDCTFKFSFAMNLFPIQYCHFVINLPSFKY